MLHNLIALGGASVTVTTDVNGQINLAIFAEKKAPFSITFSADQIAHAELEITNYCQQHAPINTVVHVGQNDLETAPVAQSAPATQAAPVTTRAATPAPQAAPVPVSTGNIEDDILANFAL